MSLFLSAIYWTDSTLKFLQNILVATKLQLKRNFNVKAHLLLNFLINIVIFLCIHLAKLGKYYKNRMVYLQTTILIMHCNTIEMVKHKNLYHSISVPKMLWVLRIANISCLQYNNFSLIKMNKCKISFWYSNCLIFLNLTILGLNGGWTSLFSIFSQSIRLKKAWPRTSSSPLTPQPSRFVGFFVKNWNK